MQNKAVQSIIAPTFTVNIMDLMLNECNDSQINTRHYFWSKAQDKDRKQGPWVSVVVWSFVGDGAVLSQTQQVHFILVFTPFPCLTPCPITVDYPGVSITGPPELSVNRPSLVAVEVLQLHLTSQQQVLGDVPPTGANRILLISSVEAGLGPNIS